MQQNEKKKRQSGKRTRGHRSSGISRITVIVVSYEDLEGRVSYDLEDALHDAIDARLYVNRAKRRAHVHTTVQ